MFRIVQTQLDIEFSWDLPFIFFLLQYMLSEDIYKLCVLGVKNIERE